MSLRSLILHNFWSKLFSLVLATLIWLAVHFGIQIDFALAQPMQVEHLATKQLDHVPIGAVVRPGESRSFRISPAEVNVVVMGSEAALLRVSLDTIHLHVDLTGFRDPVNTNCELHADVPKDLTLMSIAPPSVRVERIAP